MISDLCDAPVLILMHICFMAAYVVPRDLLVAVESDFLALPCDSRVPPFPRKNPALRGILIFESRDLSRKLKNPLLNGFSLSLFSTWRKDKNNSSVVVHTK
jgi:hypothetical protein